MTTQVLWPKKILLYMFVILLFLFWTAKHSRSDGNLADENYDGLWRIDQFNSEDHLPTQREKHFDISGYGFKDGYSPERRLLLHIYIGLTNRPHMFHGIQII